MVTGVRERGMNVLMEDEEWDKCIGQYRLTVNQVLKPLRLYGQSDYVDTATEELVSLGIQLYQKLCGIDEPYHINDNKLRY